MWTACILASHGRITPEQFLEIVLRHMDSRPPIGRIALRDRLLTVKQVVAILKEQSNKPDPFGKIAVELGFLTEDQVSYLLAKQAQEALPIDDLAMQVAGLTPDELAVEKMSLHRLFNSGPENDCLAIDGGPIVGSVYDLTGHAPLE